MSIAVTSPLSDAQDTRHTSHTVNTPLDVPRVHFVQLLFFAGSIDHIFVNDSLAWIEQFLIYNTQNVQIGTIHDFPFFSFLYNILALGLTKKVVALFSQFHMRVVLTK